VTVESTGLWHILRALARHRGSIWRTRHTARSKLPVFHHSTRVGKAIFEDVEMKYVLTALAKRLPKRTDIKGPKPADLGVPSGKGNDKITVEALYPRWSRFLKPDDILVAETGTSSMGLGLAKMPKGATFHNQTLWGAIGWATPAAFGAALAAPDRRTVLVTGEGSHQLTAQEVGQFHRRGLKPIIFLLNNNGYLIERLLCKDPNIYYNDLAQWHYHLLPQALGCDGWFTARVDTCGGTRRRNEQGRVMRHWRVYRGGHGQIRRAAYGDEVARVRRGALPGLSQCS